MNAVLQVKLPFDLAHKIESVLEKAKKKLTADLATTDKEIQAALKKIQAGDAKAEKDLPKLNTKRKELSNSHAKLTMAAVMRAGTAKLMEQSEDKVLGLLMQDEIGRGKR